MTAFIIMSAPSFAELCFLIAFILLLLAFIVQLGNSPAAAASGPLTSAGLAVVALAFLAL